MNFAELPTTKSLWYRISFALLAVTFLFVLTGCASIEIMTKQVAFDVLNDPKGDNFDDFQFLLSTAVTLVYNHKHYSTESNQTRVRQENVQDEFRISERTPGRLVTGDFTNVLSVYFDEKDGTRLIIKFTQNKGTGLNDRYYINWRIDPVTGERIIDHDNGEYVVNYSGDEEPYLLYRRIEKTKKNIRRVRGIR